MDNGYRHIFCGQVTMQSEAHREGKTLFCVNCGKHFADTHFVDAVTHKELPDA